LRVFHLTGNAQGAFQVQTIGELKPASPLFGSRKLQPAARAEQAQIRFAYLSMANSSVRGIGKDRMQRRHTRACW